MAKQTPTIRMRATKYFHNVEGEIFPGDVFAPGYTHTRTADGLEPKDKVRHVSPETRSKQINNRKLAEFVEDGSGDGTSHTPASDFDTPAVRRKKV